jgi:hypothetical protein
MSLKGKSMLLNCLDLVKVIGLFLLPRDEALASVKSHIGVNSI